MKLSYLLIAVSLIALGWPGFSETGGSYQDYLWTGSGEREDSSDLFFQRGHIQGIHTWKRLHLGWPSEAVTIDRLPEKGIIQGRIEWLFILFNLAITLTPVMLAALLWSLAERMEKQQRDFAEREFPED